MPRIALVGDYDPAIKAHAAIPHALALANPGIEYEWVGTERPLPQGFDGIWVVPGSPYRSFDGALAAIRHARENKIPFLGTCGGFQHALIEIARNVAGIAKADHAESNASAEDLIVVPLSCSLVEQNGAVSFAARSRLAGIFNGKSTTEGYHCSYGVNAAYRAQLEKAGVQFTGFDDAGDIRAMELSSHPFFIATLFQPERSALRGVRHPLIQAFVRAVV